MIEIGRVGSSFVRLAVLDSEDDRQQEDDGQEHQDAGEHPALRNAGQRLDCTYVTIALVVVLSEEKEKQVRQTFVEVAYGQRGQFWKLKFSPISPSVLTADGQSGVSL